MSKGKLTDKLNRFHDQVAGHKPAAPKNKPPESYRQLAKKLGGRIHSNHAGSYCLVKKHFPLTYQHGSMQLADVADNSQLPLAAFCVEDDPGSISPQSFLFLDTETTGMGGAGVVAFLIGVGSITSDGFEIRQYLIPDYSDEAAMLEALLEEFSPEKTLVTYNGAAFDLPLVLDRMIINRVGRRIDSADHVDLLPPTRRLYRRRLADCTLVNVERQLLDFHRHDDIPGYLIPSVYFDWLSERRTELLSDVMEHNRHDIISMLFLIRILAEVYVSDGRRLQHIDDLHSLSRLFGRRKDNHKVTALYDRIDDLAGFNLEEDVVYYHSIAFRRTGDFDRAVELWERLAESRSKYGFLANIELAKHFEHRVKAPDRALSCAARAAEAAGISSSQRRFLDARLRRLKRKRPPT